MTSPLLALFARSLREDTRLKMTYFARVGLVMIILLFMFSVEAEMGWQNAPGLSFFSKVMVIDCVFIVLAGCGWFASAITEEKEEMTLGLLRMTNLNPLSILLGKSTSRLCGALLLLAAQLPFTVLAITLGGISLGQIGAAYCTLGAFLVFLANLALLASVVSKRSAGAAALTILALVVFFAVVPVLNWIAHLPAQLGIISADAAWVSALDGLADFALTASPFFRLTQILTTSFDERIFGWQAASNLALGAGCFLLAWLFFDLFCDEQQESAPRRGGVLRRRAFLHRLGAGRTWKRALAWKDFYFLAGGKVWILAKYLIYGLPLLATVCWPEKWGGPPPLKIFGFITMWIAWLIFCIELAFVAASIFKVERQAYTLSTLATLPMSMQRIALHKIIGVLPALLPTITYFALGCLCIVPSIFKQITGGSQAYGTGSITALLVIAYTAAQGVFFLLLTANLSLRVKRGALPLAIAVQFVLQFFLSIAYIATIRDEWAFAPLLVLTLFAIVFLYRDIFQRLEILAAEE